MAVGEQPGATTAGAGQVHVQPIGTLRPAGHARKPSDPWSKAGNRLNMTSAFEFSMLTAKDLGLPPIPGSGVVPKDSNTGTPQKGSTPTHSRTPSKGTPGHSRTPSHASVPVLGAPGVASPVHAPGGAAAQQQGAGTQQHPVEGAAKAEGVPQVLDSSGNKAAVAAPKDAQQGGNSQHQGIAGDAPSPSRSPSATSSSSSEGGASVVVHLEDPLLATSSPLGAVAPTAVNPGAAAAAAGAPDAPGVVIYNTATTTKSSAGVTAYIGTAPQPLGIAAAGLETEYSLALAREASAVPAPAAGVPEDSVWSGVKRAAAGVLGGNVLGCMGDPVGVVSGPNMESHHGSYQRMAGHSNGGGGILSAAKALTGQLLGDANGAAGGADVGRAEEVVQAASVIMSAPVFHVAME
jgi:hypothetical protein